MKGQLGARAVVLAILLGAFALRVYRLGERPIWYDEAFSVFLAEQNMPEIVQGTAADIQPPLYYFLLHIWQSLGQQVFTMRFLSVGLSMLALPFVYLLAARLISRAAGTFALLFAALLPFQVYYAQELRMYALLQLALLVYWYAFVNLRSGRRPAGNIAALAASGAAALYSQSLAVLTWIVPDLYLIWRRDGKSLRNLIIGQVLGLVLFLPWLVVLVGQIANIQRAYWTSRPGLADVLQTLLAFTTDQPLPEWFLPAALFVTLAAVAVLALEIVRAFRRGAASGLELPLAFLVAPPLLMFVLSYAMRSVYVVRAVILSSLGFAMLLGWLVTRVSSMRPRTIAAVGGGLFLAAALVYQLSYSGFPRSSFRDVDAFLRTNMRAGDSVIHDNKLTFFPMHYYDPALPQTWIPDPPGAGSDTLALETMQALRIFPTPLPQSADAPRVWFVIYQRAIDEALREGHPPANQSWMDTHYTQVALVQFDDLDVYEYRK